MIGISYALVQLILFVLWLQDLSLTNTATIPAAVLNIIAAIEVVLLSFFEHSRSVRPSTLLISHLSLTCLFDLAQLRTLFLLSGFETLAAVESAIVISKFALLLCEIREKTLFLRPKYQHLSLESTSSIISRSLLWWLNGIFTRGYRSLSTFLNSYDLDFDLGSQSVAERAQRQWDERGMSIDLCLECVLISIVRPEGRLALVLSLSSALGAQFLLVIFPRLCLIGFTFAQPFLISRILNLLSQPDNETTRNQAYGLIAATALIYVGIAV